MLVERRVPESTTAHIPEEFSHIIPGMIEEEIKALTHELMEAMRKRDEPTLDRILSDDFVIAGWQPEGRLADKKFYIADVMITR